MAKSFTHLHAHSQYSLLDGIIRFDELMPYLKELNMNACAITDHGNLHGALEFYGLARAAGIKPILGCEIYLTLDPDNIENSERERRNYHLTLLAKNLAGWKNLIWLSSNAYFHNFYYKPRVCFGHLASHSEGIIALSGCLASIVARSGHYDKEKFTFSDPDNAAESMLLGLNKIFKDNFYAEIQDNAMWEQNRYNKWLISKARQLNIPTVITTDAHYLRFKDHELHKMILAQQMKKTMEQYIKGDELRYGNGYYIRSIDEMFDAAVRQGSEEAFWNTQKIADQCNLELTLGKYQNPEFDITKCKDYEDFRRWNNKQG